jgi:hypothetical protein
MKEKVKSNTGDAPEFRVYLQIMSGYTEVKWNGWCINTWKAGAVY